MNLPRSVPRNAEIWWVDLEPVRGHEQGRKRPCLVVSVDEFNQIPHGLIWVLPITTQHRWTSFTVEINTAKTGLKQKSRILCHQLRTISLERLISRIGSIDMATMVEVRLRLGMILGFA